MYSKQGFSQRVGQANGLLRMGFMMLYPGGLIGAFDGGVRFLEALTGSFLRMHPGSWGCDMD